MIALYQHHGMHEHFHSEFKTDLDEVADLFVESHHRMRSIWDFLGRILADSGDLEGFSLHGALKMDG